MAKEVLLLIFAGTDTTSYMLSQCAIWLAKYPEWLEVLWEEQQRIMAEFGDEITPKVRAELPRTQERGLHRCGDAECARPLHSACASWVWPTGAHTHACAQ
jgi:cytochrome P450